MTKIIIRKGEKRDVPEILEMIKELADFEGFLKDVHITEKELEYDGFICNPPMYRSVVAQDPADGRLVGHVMYANVYSSWVGRSSHVEDFYVKPAHRKRGVGSKLFKEMCKAVHEEGSSCLNWIVLKDNQEAIRFYDNIGAINLGEKENRVAYRMDKRELSTAIL